MRITGYQPKGATEKDLAFIRLIDQQYLKTSIYGSRKIAEELRRKGYAIGRKRVQRLMGLQAIYCRPKTSKSGKGHKIYPYLLNGLKITRPNQVRAANITYIPMAKGFLYLVAVIDWYSRYVLSWRLSNTPDADFCTDVMML